MGKQTLYIISDAYFNSFSDQAREVFDVAGCTNTEDAISDLINYNGDELKGVLYASGETEGEEILQDIDRLLSAGKFLEGTIVIYVGNIKILNKVIDVTKEYHGDVKVRIVKGISPLTEQFINSNVLSVFCSDNPYKETPDLTETDKIMSRININTKSEDLNEEADMLISLVDEVIENCDTITINMEEYLKKSDKTIKEDSLVFKIQEEIENTEIQLDSPSTEDDIKENLKIKLTILELLKDNRQGIIKSESIRNYIEFLDKAVHAKGKELSEDFSNNELHLTTDELKEQKAQIETNFKNIILENCDILNDVQRLMNSKDIKRSILILTESKHDRIVKRILPSLAKRSTETNTDYKVLKILMANIIKDWNLSLAKLSIELDRYLNIGAIINLEEETALKMLTRQSTYPNLQDKMYIIDSLEEGLGSSLVATGLTANYKNPLLVDLRLNKTSIYSHLGDIREEDKIDLEELLLLNNEGAADVIRAQKPKYILPGDVIFSLNTQEDKNTLMNNIIEILENTHHEYDMITVITNNNSVESEILLSYGIIYVAPITTNSLAYSSYKMKIDKSLTQGNHLVKYLVMTPCHESTDLQNELEKFGYSEDDGFRVRAIPYLDIDSHKSRRELFFNRNKVERRLFNL